MKILLISSDIEWSQKTYVTCLAAPLVARGHEVHVLSCKHGNRSRDELWEGVWIHRRPLMRIRGLRRLERAPVVGALVRRLQAPRFVFGGPWLSPLLRLNQALSNRRHSRRLGVDFDVIEAPEHMAEGLFLGSTPLVVQFQGPLGAVLRYWSYRPGWHWRLSEALERRAARRATVTSACSSFVVRELTAAGWRGIEDTRVIPAAIDAETWSDVPDASGTAPVILAVGFVGMVKGSDVLVRAASRLLEELPDVEVVLVGGTEQHANGDRGSDLVGKLAAELGVRCRLVGHVDRSELPAWYERARVVALPSRFDAFPAAGLEAMAAGRPLVCSSRNGVSELAGEADGAITVVPAEDPERLADALRPFLSDSSHAAAVGQRGRAFVHRCCGPDEIGSRREALYLDAARVWRERRGKRTRKRTRRS